MMGKIELYLSLISFFSCGTEKSIVLLNFFHGCRKRRPKADGYGLTTCHVCSIFHGSKFLVKRGRFGGISEMRLLLLRGQSLNGTYVLTRALFMKG
jgi:hypothetical protein